MKYPENTTPHPVTMTQIVSFVFGDETEQARFAKRFKQHLERIRQVAESGNPTAQYLYATLAYHNPFFLKKKLISAEEANNWLLQAAKNGHDDAQFILGQNILSGKGCQADKQKGLFWISQAAEQGNPRAAHLIADMLEDDSIENHTGRSAKEWLQSAAEAGDADAMLRWAQVVAEAEDATADELAQAREYLKKVKKQRKPGPQWYRVSARLYQRTGETRKAARAEKKPVSWKKGMSDWPNVAI